MFLAIAVVALCVSILKVGAFFVVAGTLSIIVTSQLGLAKSQEG